MTTRIRRLKMLATLSASLAALGLTGLLMPAGILGEIYLGLSPVFVLIGAAAMTASVLWCGVLSLRHWS